MTRVLITLDTGATWEGLLATAGDSWVTLAAARLHDGNAEPTTVPGEVILPRARIEFVQVPGANP